MVAAVLIRTLAWTGSGLLPVSSRKLVLWSHPADVVLSVIERAQSLRCHAVVGLSIKVDGCPEAGDFVCHPVVDLLTIKADECPEAVDFVCQSVVDLLTIEADGCPEAGDFVCHSVVDGGLTDHRG